MDYRSQHTSSSAKRTRMHCASPTPGRRLAVARPVRPAAGGRAQGLREARLQHPERARPASLGAAPAPPSPSIVVCMRGRTPGFSSASAIGFAHSLAFFSSSTVTCLLSRALVFMIADGPRLSFCSAAANSSRSMRSAARSWWRLWLALASATLVSSSPTTRGSTDPRRPFATTPVARGFLASRPGRNKDSVSVSAFHFPMVGET